VPEASLEDGLVVDKPKFVGSYGTVATARAAKLDYSAPTVSNSI